MKLKDLNYNVKVEWKGTCLYKVTILWHRKEYTCLSNDSLSWDRMKDSDLMDSQKGTGGMTYKQSLESFYQECKRKNKIGEYAEKMIVIKCN